MHLWNHSFEAEIKTWLHPEINYEKMDTNAVAICIETLIHSVEEGSMDELRGNIFPS